MAKKNILLAATRYDARLMAIAFDLDLDKWELESIAGAARGERFERVVVQIPARLKTGAGALLQQAKSLLRPGAVGGIHFI